MIDKVSPEIASVEHQIWCIPAPRSTIDVLLQNTFISICISFIHCFQSCHLQLSVRSTRSSMIFVCLQWLTIYFLRVILAACCHSYSLSSINELHQFHSFPISIVIIWILCLILITSMSYLWRSSFDRRFPWIVLITLNRQICWYKLTIFKFAIIPSQYRLCKRAKHVHFC